MLRGVIFPLSPFQGVVHLSSLLGVKFKTFRLTNVIISF